LNIPADVPEEWIKQEIKLQENILNKLHLYMQGTPLRANIPYSHIEL